MNSQLIRRCLALILTLASALFSSKAQNPPGTDLQMEPQSQPGGPGANWGNSRPRVEYYVNPALNQPRFEPEGSAERQITLKGHVTGPAGEPLRAIVLIQSALPAPDFKFTPTARFPNLPRYAQTDDHGHFDLGGLNPGWRYYVRVMAPQFHEHVIETLDPANEPLNIQLQPESLASFGPDQILRGRVMDAANNPAAGALIQILGVTRNNSMQWPAPDIGPYAVSDDEGYFTVTASRSFEAAEGAVTMPGFVTELFEDWAPGEKIHTVILKKGASLAGRVLQNDAPVANAEIRIGRFGRESGSSVWNYSALTDPNGRFEFQNLPPDRNGFIYGTMESLGKKGSFPEQWVQVGGAGSTKELPDIHLEPAFDIAGKIQLADGKAIPPNAQLLLHRSNGRVMMDGISTAVAQDGSFRFANVPAEAVQILVRVPGYEFTPGDRFLMAGSSTNIEAGPGMLPLVLEMHPRTEVRE